MFLLPGQSKRGVVLGRVAPFFSPKIFVPEHARSGHMYVAGKTGKGKSKFLLTCIYQDILNGYGCAVIDPHSDLIADLLSLLIERGVLDDPKQRERIIYLNPVDKDYVIPFNVLADAKDPYGTTKDVVEAFKRAWQETLSAAPNFTSIMSHSLLVLIRAKRTLIDLPRLLTDYEYREQLLERVSDPILTAFFHDRFDAWGRERVLKSESTLNKVDEFTINPHLSLQLSQPQNHLDFRNIMDSQKVLLADLGRCDDETQLLIGNLITRGMEQAAFSRHDIIHSKRTPFYMYIDEFQDFSSNGNVKTLSRILSGARKFGLHMILAHQNLSQLSERMREAIMGNTWTKILFGVSRTDAEYFVREIAQIDPSEVKHEAQTDTQHPVYSPLPEQLHLWAEALNKQVPRRAFVHDYKGRTKVMWTLPTKVLDSTSENVKRFCKESRRRYGVPYEDAVKHLNEALNISTEQLTHEYHYSEPVV